MTTTASASSTGASVIERESVPWFPLEESLLLQDNKDIDKVLNNKIDNYHLTFSYTGLNMDDCVKALDKGVNVAMVFKDKLLDSFKGYKVIEVNGNPGFEYFSDREDVLNELFVDVMEYLESEIR